MHLARRAFVLVLLLASCDAQLFRSCEREPDEPLSTDGLPECKFGACWGAFAFGCRYDWDCHNDTECTREGIWRHGTCIHRRCQFSAPLGCETADDCHERFTHLPDPQECIYVPAADRRLCKVGPEAATGACYLNTAEYGGGPPCGPCGVEGIPSQVCQCVFDSGYALCVPGTEAVLVCRDEQCLPDEWHTPHDAGPADATPPEDPCVDAGPGPCEAIGPEPGESCPEGYFTCPGAFGWICYRAEECDRCCMEHQEERCDADAGPWPG